MAIKFLKEIIVKVFATAAVVIYRAKQNAIYQKRGWAKVVAWAIARMPATISAAALTLPARIAIIIHISPQNILFGWMIFVKNEREII